MSPLPVGERSTRAARRVRGRERSERALLFAAAQRLAAVTSPDPSVAAQTVTSSPRRGEVDARTRLRGRAERAACAFSRQPQRLAASPLPEEKAVDRKQCTSPRRGEVDGQHGRAEILVFFPQRRLAGYFPSPQPSPRRGEGEKSLAASHASVPGDRERRRISERRPPILASRGPHGRRHAPACLAPARGWSPDVRPNARPVPRHHRRRRGPASAPSPMPGSSADRFRSPCASPMSRDRARFRPCRGT